MIIISGCSFLASKGGAIETRFADYDIKNYASRGAGNDYISASIVDAVQNATQKIDYAFVLWSGIMRYDIPIGSNIISLLGSDYSFKAPVGNSHYIHSGGIYGSWSRLAKSPYTEFVEMFYHEPNRAFYTDRTVNNMFIAKCVLESHNIPYDFGFIYDPHAPDGKQELSLGQAAYDISEHYNIKSAPMEFCIEHDMLRTDSYHPSPEGLLAWLNSIKLKID